MSGKTKTAREPIKIGDVVGVWHIDSHVKNELFACTCTAGHKEIRSRNTILAPTSACRQCRREARYAQNVGTTIGKITITGVVTQPSKQRGRENEVVVRYSTVCVCGHKSTVSPRDVARGKVSGRSCVGCRDKKFTDAVRNPHQFTDQEAKEINIAIRAGTLRTLDVAEAIEHMGVQSQCWIELLQYDLSQKSFKQIAAAAYTLAKRLAISTILKVRAEHAGQIEPDSDSDENDVFADLEIKPNEPESDELHEYALDSLTTEEKNFLLDFVQSRTVKSHADKQRHKALTNKARASLAGLLDMLEESTASQ